MKSTESEQENLSTPLYEARRAQLRRARAGTRPGYRRRRRDPRVPRPGPLSLTAYTVWEEIQGFANDVSCLFADLLPSWVLLRHPHDRQRVNLDSSSSDSLSPFPPSTRIETSQLTGSGADTSELKPSENVQ